MFDGKEISENLKRFREEKGLSKAVVSKRLNVNRSNITRWELGSVLPNIVHLVALSEVLEIPLTKLIGLKEEGVHA